MILLIMVNTFLPCASFRKCARTLDYRRLGKQRVEAMQIIRTIERIEKGEDNFPWSHHPAVRMWIGYSNSLKFYHNCMIKEWIKRGYKNNMVLYEIEKPIVKPWWVKWKPFQYSHRASLLRKAPDFYQEKFYIPKKYHKYGYIWPSKLDSQIIKLAKKNKRVNVKVIFADK